jgi:DNA repair protein RadC
MKKSVARSVKTWRSIHRKSNPLDVTTLSDAELLEHFLGADATAVLLENVPSIEALLKLERDQVRALQMLPKIGEGVAAQILVLIEISKRK